MLLQVLLKKAKVKVKIMPNGSLLSVTTFYSQSGNFILRQVEIILFPINQSENFSSRFKI